jgi:hypothetical protein
VFLVELGIDIVHFAFVSGCLFDELFCLVDLISEVVVDDGLCFEDLLVTRVRNGLLSEFIVGGFIG